MRTPVGVYRILIRCRWMPLDQVGFGPEITLQVIRKRTDPQISKIPFQLETEREEYIVCSNAEGYGVVNGSSGMKEKRVKQNAIFHLSWPFAHSGDYHTVPWD